MRGTQKRSAASALVLVGVLSPPVSICLCPPSTYAQAARPAPEPTPQILNLEDLQPAADQLIGQGLSFEKSKDPGRALLLYEDVLRYHGQGDRAEEALFRIASCYRQLGRFEEARNTLALRQKQYPASGSPWRPPSRLLEGEMLAAEARWKEALPALQDGATASERELQLRAHYLAVLAADNLKDLALARPNIEALVREKKEHPYADYARLKQGTLAASEGKSSIASQAFKEVLARTGDPALRAEAGVRAGNLAYASGAWREAAANFEVVRKTNAPDFWRQLAHLGLLQSAFAAGDHARLLEIYREVRPAFPEASRAQVLFLVAESTRLTKQDQAALEAYDFFLKEFPNDPMAESAVWARILILRGQNNPDLVPETARFLGGFPNSTRRPTVQLLRAEAFFDRGDFKTCTPMLADLAGQTEAFAALQSVVREGVLFRWGRAALGLGDWPQARKAFDRLLADFPKTSLRSSALWMQGQAALRDKDPEAAFTSWTARVQDFPKDADRENTLWQTALLAGSLGKLAPMRSLLQAHLKEFPNSANTPEAHYLLAGAIQQLGDDQASRPNWEAARKLDAARYFGPATQQLIRLALLRADLPGLRTEVEAYDAWRQKNPKAPAVALSVYEWLGQELAKGDDPGSGAVYYRIVLAASKDPAQRKRSQLGLALLMSKIQNHGAAIKEWNQFRLDFPEEANRSTVLEPLAQALIGAARFDDAQTLAEQILRQNPEGEFNARGRLLLGDIAMGRRNYVDAAKYYATLALLMDDPLLTPRALWRAEKAQRLAGMTTEADAKLLELRKRFPDYRE
ncbi:MAG: tetratricopeptide repeat protein [Candidatus Methylacidiphilales bacterium]|nr:tetratricopeptide repeat protein [Candidatus Methylacidiphilales bacterium]